MADEEFYVDARRCAKIRRVPSDLWLAAAVRERLGSAFGP
jgi:hypothetical protein